jgi:hypothetical protein
MLLVASAQNSPAKRFRMMDTLVYFVDNFANGTCFLMDCDKALGYRGRLTLEISNYISYYFLSIALSGSWNRVLVRCQASLTCLAKPIAIFRNILPLLTTDSMRKIFDEFHI